MSTKQKIFPLLIITALVLGACQAAPTQPLSPGEGPARRTITVEGTGQVSLEPDLARISIGVQTENRDAQQAVEDNNDQVEAVLSALEDMDVAPEDIQTANFSIRRQEDREPKPELEGDSESTASRYVVNNTVRVTLRDLDTLGNVLDEVVSAGANTIHGIQFDATGKEDANRQALELAVKDARARAEAIAEAAEVEVGEVVQVETFGGGPVFAAEREEMADTGRAVPISAGQLQISVNARVSYAIQ